MGAVLHIINDNSHSIKIYVTNISKVFKDLLLEDVGFCFIRHKAAAAVSSAENY